MKINETLENIKEINSQLEENNTQINDINNKKSDGVNNLIQDLETYRYDIPIDLYKYFELYSNSYPYNIYVRNYILYIDTVIKRKLEGGNTIIENFPFETYVSTHKCFQSTVCNSGFTSANNVIGVFSTLHDVNKICSLLLDEDLANISGANTINGCYYLPINTRFNLDVNEGFTNNKLESSIDNINNMNGSKVILFSDTHTSTTDSTIRLNEIKKLRTINYCLDKTKSNLGILLGDISNDYNHSTKESHKSSLTSIRRSLLPNVLSVQGNHDTGGNNNDCYVNRVFNPEELFNILTRGKTNISVTPEGKKRNFYYYDDNENNVRYVILNSTDTPTEINGDSYVHNLYNEYAFSNEQINWLANIALKTTNDVVLCSHIGLLNETELPDDNCGTPKNYEVIRTLLGKLKNRQSGNITKSDGDFSVNVDYDFTLNTNKIAFSVFGHYHYEVNFVDENGIRHIGIDDMLGQYLTTTKDYCKDYQRDSTPEKIVAGRIVNIDTLNKKVTMYPIGQESTIEFNY